MAAIRQRIASRRLSQGDKLPSIRGFAATMSVSPSTVVEAYDRLVAEGVIRSRPGSGFFVSSQSAPLIPSKIAPRLDRRIDPFWVSRQSLDASPDALKPGCGWMPPDWMPNEAIRKALRAVARADDAVLSEYGGAHGHAGLRQLLARQMADDGINATPEQIMLTGSGTQAIDLICRFLLRPGDTVLVDDPCYFNFQALLNVHQVKIVSVPYTPSGPDVERFSAALTAHQPRLYITNTALQNPTGATMAPQIAHQILTTAAAHDLIIVEDDIFDAFEPEPSLRLAALDGLARVIRIGSFSKTLSASVRCGYIAARADWIEPLVDMQIATNFGGPSPVAAQLLFATLSDGSFRRHMEATRRSLARERQRVTEKLGTLGVKPWTVPRGGFYLWCELPGDLDAAEVARAALHEDVLLAPGNVFSPSLSKPSFMRFNVSQMRDARVYEVLARALDVVANPV